MKISFNSARILIRINLIKEERKITTPIIGWSLEICLVPTHRW